MSKLAKTGSASALALMSLGLWSGFGLAGPALAQEFDDDEIVVTATRREQALQDVPIAVSAFSSEDLDRLNVTSTNDLQRIAPSLVISTSTSETGGSTLRIRGVGTTGNNAGLEGAVGVFIDGVYRQRAGLALQNMFDIARIEVLRGPQGTLFGKNTSAGALSIVPNLPSMQHEFAAEFTAGNYGNMDFEGMVNIPLSEQFAIRIAGAAQVRDGVMDGVIFDNNGIVGYQDFNNRDRELVRVMALYEPNNAITWRLTADYSNKDEACCASPYSFYAPTNVSRLLAGPIGGATVPANQFERVALVNEAPVERTEEYGISSHLSIDLSSDVTLNTIAAYRRFRSNNNADVDFGPADILRQRIPAVQQLTSFEASLTGDFGRLDWLVGAFYAEESIDSTNSTIYGVDTGRYVAAGWAGPSIPFRRTRSHADRRSAPPISTAIPSAAATCRIFSNRTARPGRSLRTTRFS